MGSKVWRGGMTWTGWDVKVLIFRPRGSFVYLGVLLIFNYIRSSAATRRR